MTRPRYPRGAVRRNQSEPVLPGMEAEARLVTPMARAATRKSASAKPTPAPAPWLAVVLAVDTATVSGWAISVNGQRVDSGEIHTHDTAGLDARVAWAVNLGELARVPVVLVLEAPWGGDVRIVTALGAASERWLRAWRDAGQAGGRVVRVMPSTWRSAVLGRVNHGMRRDEIRAVEQAAAERLARRPVGPDEAPAILIARWGSHAAKVGAAIGVRAVRASLKSWIQPKG